MNKIVLRADDFDGYLTQEDKDSIDFMDKKYAESLHFYEKLLSIDDNGGKNKAKDKLISLYNEMGKMMQSITKREPNIHVYSFETPNSIHGEASRLIAKLRDPGTEHPEFVYYIQRAYELLFNLAFGGSDDHRKNYIFIKTAVNIPIQHYAVHKIPYVDDKIKNSVMCVMLRGALLPSMIMSKEIQEYSSINYVTPFALFKIHRDDTKEEHNMEYILDLERSHFNLEQLDGKDLVFADPMNATGGSLITIIHYLKKMNIKPKSIRFFNVISVLKGSLRIVRAVENAEIYTLWMDPALNKKAYIVPGLGDAGDRINGEDSSDNPRDMIQLIADYGVNIISLYKSQVRKIEETVLYKSSP